MNNHIGFSNCWMTKERRICPSYFSLITIVILMPYSFYKQDLYVRISHIVVLCEIILYNGKSLLHIIDIWYHRKQNLQDALNVATDTVLIFLLILCSAHCFCLASSMIEQIERTCKNFASLMAGDGLNLGLSQNQNALKYNSVLEWSLPSCQDTCLCTYICTEEVIADILCASGKYHCTVRICLTFV